MREAMVTSIAGLVGVLVGGWLGPIFHSRTIARADAHLAARLARAGLQDWVKAVEMSNRATSRLDHSNFDIELAIFLSGLRKSLDLRWWEDNRTALLRRANVRDEEALERAGKTCRFVLWRLDFLGDAGEEANVRKARAAIASRRRLQAVRADRARSTSDDLSDDSEDQSKVEPQVRFAASFQAVDEMNEELEGLKVLVAGFDHKIAMARDIWSDFNGISGHLDAAINACNAIERENRPWPSPSKSNRPRRRRHHVQPLD